MSENNSPINNEALEELLAKRKELLAAGDKQALIEHMNNIAQEIALNAKFLTVVRLSETPTLKEDGTVNLNENTKVGFVMLNAQDGSTWHPAFTSWDEVFKWKDIANESAPPQSFIVGFDQFISMLKSNPGPRGIVINPFSDNLVIPRELLEKWADTKAELIKPKPGTHVVKGGLAAIMDDPSMKQ